MGCTEFSCLFNQAVGFQCLSLGQVSGYKFRERWIPVPLPPPVRSRPTFSASLRARPTGASGSNKRSEKRALWHGARLADAVPCGPIREVRAAAPLPGLAIRHAEAY